MARGVARFGRLAAAASTFFALSGFQGIAVPAGWELMAPAEAPFVVLLPSKAAYSVSNAEAPGYGPYKTHLWRIATGGVTYIVAATNYPSGMKVDPEAELKANLDAMLKGLKDSKVTSRKRIELQHLPALEYTMETPTTALRGLFAVDGPRGFGITVVRKLGSEESEEMQAFFRSFRIVK